MKKLMITTLLFCSLFTLQAQAQCAKCDQIRAYNAAHPENNYTYYEDYLKSQQAKQQQAQPAEKQKENAPEKPS